MDFIRRVSVGARRTVQALLLLGAATCLRGSAAAESSDSMPQSAADRKVRIRELINASRLASADSAAQVHLMVVSTAKHVDSLAVADAIDQLLEVMQRMARAGAPEFHVLAERNIRIREKYAKPDDLETADAWQLLAAGLRAVGDQRGALALYHRALAMQERVLGPDDLEVSRTVNRMVGPNRALGDRATARALLGRALAIRERLLPPEHRDIALVLGNIALMDMEDGEYTLARERYQRVMKSYELAEGPDGTQVGITLLNVSTLSTRLGDTREACAQLERAIRILSAKLGSERYEVCIARMNLGANLLKLQQPAKAESLLRVVVEVLERTKAGDPAIRSEAMVGLARACADMGGLTEADSLFRRALDQQVAATAPDHWDVAKTLRAMAELAEHRGDARGAEEQWTRALQIDESSLGPDHPTVALDLQGRARSRLRAGESSEALADALRAEQISARHLRATARALPERRAMEYAAVRANGMSLSLAALAEHAADPGHVASVWDALIRSRAIVLDELASRQPSAWAEADSGTLALAKRSAELHRKLANLFVRGIADSAGGFRAEIGATQHACDSVDSELAARSARWRAQSEAADAGLLDVLTALTPGDALVAFARQEAGDDEMSLRSATTREQYFAFVARSGAAPIAVALGSAARIDSLVHDWRERMRVAAEGHGRPSDLRALRRAGESLRRETWDAVARHLGAVERVVVVGDGALHLVNFAALPSGTSGYLLEGSRELRLLSTERELLRSRPPVDQRLLAFGGADFENTLDGPAGGDPSQRTGPAAFRSVTPQCDALSRDKLAPLPGSEREVAEIAAMWDRLSPQRPASTILTGAYATEAAFKRLAPSSGWIHVATHGYFLDDRCIVGSAAGTSLQSDRLSPLLRSGLMLAGANRRDTLGTGDDGVLTAEEVATLDLSGAGAVTLSACDSGLGSLVAGEGVFGLRRAFEIAGAQSIVMSLWRVTDQDTRHWMRALYEARLGSASSMGAAAHLASMKILREQRASSAADDPSKWAGFVVSGDWR